MSRFMRSTLFLSLAAYAAAQTSTSCNPRLKTCPKDPALGTTFSTEFNSSMAEIDSRFFNVTAGSDLISFTDDGAELTLTNEGDSITIQTAFYIMFGHIEVIFKAATGQGIISTVNTLSDDLDEIDWEIKGTNFSSVTNNYFGWGNTSQYNSEFIPTTGGAWGPQGAMGDFHNYTINWTKDNLQYILDGNVVREAAYKEAGLWPQTPSYVNIGIWSAGSSEAKGTRQWAGGRTDWDKSPFTMTVKSLRITDGTPGAAYYTYGDKSGTYESIQVEKGQSDAFKHIHEKTTSQQIAKSWSGLSTGAKIGIACGVLGLLAICLVAFTFYCVKQRRAGKKERMAADKEWDAQQAELAEYRNRMKRGEFARGYMGHGEKF